MNALSKSWKLSRAALALLVASSLCSTATHANDAIKKSVENRLGIKVEKVTKTDYLGLYEVYGEGQIIYTDEKATVFIDGSLVDGKTMQNVTGKRKIELLPLDLAIKQVRGKGTHTLITIEDPNCGYCKKLARDIQKLKDATVYTFIYPILGNDSVEKSKAILCAKDKAKAWNDWMVDNKPPTGPKDCGAPINRLVQLGRQLKVNGTPALLFSDGDRIPGAIPLEMIEEKLLDAAGGAMTSAPR